MSNASYLPAEGQIDLSRFPLNENLGQDRLALARVAKDFTQETATCKLRYNRPTKGQGTGHLKGAARIVTGLLYELLAKSPYDDLNEAIVWAIDTSVEVLPTSSLDLGNGKQGTVETKAYQLGAEYFEESLKWALEVNRKIDEARKADVDARRAASAAANAKAEAAYNARRAAAGSAKSAARNAAAKARFEANEAARLARRQGYRTTANHLTQKEGASV